MGRRCILDPALLWLWHRPVATAPIRPLAWEPLYAAGAVQEKAKRQKKKKKKKLPKLKKGVGTASAAQSMGAMVILFFFFFSRLFRAAPTVYGGYQAKD